MRLVDPRRWHEPFARHPRATLWAAALVTVAAVGLGAGVELRTSRRDLAPPDDPQEQRWQRFLADKPLANTLIAVVEAAPGHAPSQARLRETADRLAAAFQSDALTGEVFHRADLAWFETHALDLLPDAALAEALEVLDPPGRASPPRVAGVSDLAGLNTLLADRIEQGRLRSGAPGSSPGAAAAIRTLAGILRFERYVLEHPDSAALARDPGAPLLSLFAAGRPGVPPGYLGSRDGSRFFVTVTPASSSDDLPVLTRFLEAMRRHAADVAAGVPGGDVRIGFTGQAALTVEEMAIVTHDGIRTSLLAALGVLALVFFTFRWHAHAGLVFLTLLAGILWTLGVVRVVPGYLNLITTAVVPTLLGIGVAFGLHPVSDYEVDGGHAEHGAAALDRAFRATLTPVTVSALTTAAAFFTILLIPFRGFAELGLVAGIGVLLCLLAAVTVLPALLARRGTRTLAPRRPPRFDRIWMHTFAPRVARFPRVVVVLAMVLTAALGWQARKVRFDTNLMGLLPRSSEGLRYQEIVAATSDLSPFFGVIEADSLAGLRILQARAAAEPGIARFESVLDVLPEISGARRQTEERLAARLGDLLAPAAVVAFDADRVEGSLTRLEAALDASAGDAFGAGLAEIAAALEETRAAADSARMALRDGRSRGVDWSPAVQALARWSTQAGESARRAARAPAPALETLPEELRGRYLSRTGHLLAYLHPAGEVFDPEFGPRFVAAAQQVSPEATGFPVVFQRMTERITSGFHGAVAAGAGLILLILVLDFRTLRDAFLAALPLTLGVIWTLGVQGFFDIPFNFANLVAIPLVIGVGVDDGVHLMHRVREDGRMGMTGILRRSGRAIIITTLATVAGFGSLIFASHRGMASLGVLLVIGVTACLAASVVVLPNLLVWLGRVAPEGDA